MSIDPLALRLVSPPGDQSAHKTASYLGDYFAGIGWQVQHVHAEASAPATVTRQRAAGQRSRTLSLSPLYAPRPGEHTVYWLLDSTLPALLNAAPEIRERCVRHLKMGKVLAASNEGRKQLHAWVRHVDVLPSLPFVVGDILPGPYRQAIVLEAAHGADQLAGTALQALARLRHPGALELQLAGFANAAVEALSARLAPGPVQISAIEDMNVMVDAVRHALAYVVIGIRGPALEVRAEIAAAARKPLLVFGDLDTEQLDFFADGVSGFRTRDGAKLGQLIDLLADGHIDASRIGDNALRLLLSHRQPELALKEYLL